MTIIAFPICRIGNIIKILIPAYYDTVEHLRFMSVHDKKLTLNKIEYFRREAGEDINIVTIKTDLDKIKIHDTKTEKTILLTTDEYKGPKYKFAATTLFRDDYYLLPQWLHHCRKIGVEHFFLYYNGILTDDIRNNCKGTDVTLHEWNYP